MQRRILTMIATVCVIIFCAVSYQGIRSLASSGEEQLKFKYYTQVTLAYGETLWDLSEDYIDYEEYKDKKEYIDEVQSINHLAEEDSIRAGQTLIVATHRMAVLGLVDRIIVMDNGRIVADGARDEILSHRVMS